MLSKKKVKWASKPIAILKTLKRCFLVCDIFILYFEGSRGRGPVHLKISLVLRNKTSLIKKQILIQILQNVFQVKWENQCGKVEIYFKQIKEIKLTEKFVSSLGIKLYPKVKIKKENYTALKETRKTQVPLKIFATFSCIRKTLTLP